MAKAARHTATHTSSTASLEPAEAALGGGAGCALAGPGFPGLGMPAPGLTLTRTAETPRVQPWAMREPSFLDGPGLAGAAVPAAGSGVCGSRVPDMPSAPARGPSTLRTRSNSDPSSVLPPRECAGPAPFLAASPLAPPRCSESGRRLNRRSADCSTDGEPAWAGGVKGCGQKGGRGLHSARSREEGSQQEAQGLARRGLSGCM